MVKGVRAAIMCLPPSVHDAGDQHSFISILINTAKEQCFSAYIGEGENRWTIGRRMDAAVLYRLVLEEAAPGTRFYVNTEKGVTVNVLQKPLARN